MLNFMDSKAYKDYDYTSRYSVFPYYYNQTDDKYIYGITAQLDTDTVFTLHTVSRGETLDSLALKYYNNPTMYWVICAFNHIANPFTDLHEGSKLKIPSLSNIKYDFEGRF